MIPPNAPTPLKWEQFSKELARHPDLLAKFPKVVDYIRFGFPLAPVLPPITSTIIFPNHFRSGDDVEIARTYLVKEASEGRMLGPFSEEGVRDILKSHFRTAPIHLEEKSHKPGEFRIVRDFSCSIEGVPALHDLIPASRPTRQIGIDEFLRQVRSDLGDRICPRHPNIPRRVIRLTAFFLDLLTLQGRTRSPRNPSSPA